LPEADRIVLSDFHDRLVGCDRARGTAVRVPFGAAFAVIALVTTEVTAGPLHDAVKSGDLAQAGG
jgi:hypothetical protein